MALLHYDLLIIGSGIVGLAHALGAQQRGLKVAVCDRHAAPVGASIRNFGFITVTGQSADQTWERARRSRDIWAELAPRAGIDIVHRGLLVTAQRPEAMTVLEAFRVHPMGVDCRILTPNEVRDTYAGLTGEALCGALYSPHELRVHSPTAISRLIDWLKSQGVTFHFETAVTAIDPPYISTARGDICAESIVVCPGDDLNTLYPDVYDRHGVTLSKLHMMRLASPGFRLPCALMSDLSLIRYRGYAERPESAALKHRLERECPNALRHGVHLIVVQDADGALVVGDSHHYARTPDPFYNQRIEALILEEFTRVCGFPAPSVIERWLGTYPSADNDMFCEAPHPRVRLVSVTSGTGASTAFAIAEDTLKSLF
ncbi:TIGR03364 family FAD-dependent oxidoreductase [Asticcacaulis tiandongensis]|uniref:TIGR03364 family FAD-dependent oxidoreductase n=1 Tax=Asticcacaulis tiandongensis TaxID=2565365 RepID=UPI001129FD8E|nr:TIGR03364 family FAD-dependent oxidoreductase [Asticcacaulis tiandongensis]